MGPSEVNYDYSSDVLPAGDNVLAVLSGLAVDAMRAKDKIGSIEADLKVATDQHNDIVRVRMPELMISTGQKKLLTTTNLECELKDVVRASIPEERKPEAFAWLESNGSGAVIKIEIKVSLGKGAEAEMKLEKIRETLTALMVEHEIKRAVHPQTLAALVREKLALGINVPMDTLGAIVQREVTVKVPKKK